MLKVLYIFATFAKPFFWASEALGNCVVVGPAGRHVPTSGNRTEVPLAMGVGLGKGEVNHFNQVW